MESAAVAARLLNFAQGLGDHVPINDQELFGMLHRFLGFPDTSRIESKSESKSFDRESPRRVLFDSETFFELSQVDGDTDLESVLSSPSSLDLDSLLSRKLH